MVQEPGEQGVREKAKAALREMTTSQEIVCVWPEEAYFERNRPLRGLCTNDPSCPVRKITLDQYVER